MEIKNPISSTDLAKELGVNKSTIHYYVIKGVIKPINTVGKMYIFDKKETIKRINLINRLRSGKKLTLDQAVAELDNKK